MANKDEKINVIETIEEHLKKLIELIPQLENEEESDETKFRIIHAKNNPMELASRERKKEYQKLKAQNERIKLRLEFLESGETEDNLTKVIYDNNKRQQIEMLSRKVEELRQKEEKLLISYSRMGREFREVFYLLTGLRINSLSDGIHEISSMYAENESDKLLMQIGKDGTIHLLQNEFSDKLSDYIETYLEKYDSFPAFLAALTLNLFKSDTIDMSVNMEQTVINTRNPDSYGDFLSFN